MRAYSGPADQTRTTRALRIVGLVASALAVSALAVLIVQRGLGHDYAAYDLSAYLAAARRLRDGVPLYPQVGGDYRLGELDLYLYPPPVALLFVPALVLPFAVASTLWGILLTALAFAVALALARVVAPARRPLAVALVLGAFPLQWELANGNLTLVTLALSLVAWRAVERWPGALALAAAMGLKLLAVPVGLTVALAGGARLLARTALALLAVVGLSWPFVGASWGPWVRLTIELASGPQTRTYNVVPEALRAGPGRAALLALTLLALAALGLALRSRRLPPALGLAAALSAAPYASAFVFYPYAVLVLPVAVRLALGDGRAWPARAAALAGWLLVELQALDPETRWPLALAGTAVLVGTTLLVAWRARQATVHRAAGATSAPATR